MDGCKGCPVDWQKSEKVWNEYATPEAAGK
jgi:hypothetical protein